MTSADRFQASAIVSSGLAIGSDRIGFWYLTVVLLWLAVLCLTSTIREQRSTCK